MIILAGCITIIYSFYMNTYLSLRQRAYGYIVFVFFATLCSILISLRYAIYMPLPSAWYAWLYAICAYIGQMTILTLVYALCIAPCILIPIHSIRRICIVFFFSLALAVLIIDTIVFSLYRAHINKVVMDLYFVGHAVEIPNSTLFTIYGVYCFVACALYFLLAYCERTATRKYVRRIYIIITLHIICFLGANISHAWAVAFGYQPVTLITRYLPLYMPLRANTAFVHIGITDRAHIAKNKGVHLQEQGSVRYPKHTIQTHDINAPINIVWIVIDSLRFDTCTATITPNITRFAQKGIVFTNHHSTGNATRAGIFGLFYGIPATYWHAFLANQTPPLLITRMQDLGYDIQIFSSASTTMPEFHQTVFASIPNLTPGAQGKNKMERDIAITQSWCSWFATRDTTRPFFSYVFYDAVHGGGTYPSDYPVSFGNTTDDINYVTLGNSFDIAPIFNRYKTAAHFVDSLIAKILNTLEASNILDNTLVLITSDHGEEMNDNKKGYWGHNGNFTAVQTHVPLIIVPPRVPTLHNVHPPTYRTSHEDIAPTLLATYLGVENPIEDYSTGINLFAHTYERPFFVIASYAMYGIVSPDHIIEVNRYGSYEVRDHTNTPKIDIKPDFTQIRDVLAQIHSFYR